MTDLVNRASLLRALASRVSTKDLTRVLNQFPYLIEEAVRELNGEVEYVMVEKKDDGRSGKCQRRHS